MAHFRHFEHITVFVPVNRQIVSCGTNADCLWSRTRRMNMRCLISALAMAALEAPVWAQRGEPESGPLAELRRLRMDLNRLEERLQQLDARLSRTSGQPGQLPARGIARRGPEGPGAFGGIAPRGPGGLGGDASGGIAPRGPGGFSGMGFGGGAAGGMGFGGGTAGGTGGFGARITSARGEFNTFGQMGGPGQWQRGAEWERRLDRIQRELDELRRDLRERR